MKKVKIIALIFSVFYLSTNIYSQKTTEYVITDMQAFDSKAKKIEEIERDSRKILGKHIFITELENTLIFGASKDYQKNRDPNGKDLYYKKKSSLTERVYYQKAKDAYIEITINISMFSNTMTIELTREENHPAKAKKVISKAKEI